MHRVTMQRGFSLLELSIVLVIIGLLAGGVLTGQALIRAAELRGIGTDIVRFQTALNTFRDKYQALPGDMKNATAFWGLLNSDPYVCVSTAATGTATCNGDGDGIIYASGTSIEPFRMWQHLANAGMIEGKYTGANVDPDWRVITVGVNVPASKISQVGYNVRSFGDMRTDDHFYPDFYDNVMLIGRTLAGTDNWGTFLKPEEVWSIDTKLDDGKPAYGQLRVTTPNYSVSSDCATSATASVAVYKNSYSSVACTILYMLRR